MEEKGKIACRDLVVISSEYDHYRPPQVMRPTKISITFSRFMVNRTGIRKDDGCLCVVDNKFTWYKLKPGVKRTGRLLGGEAQGMNGAYL